MLMSRSLRIRTTPERREVAIDCRYVGFESPNRFVIGYGLDFDEQFRGLRYVAALDESRLPAAVG